MKNYISYSGFTLIETLVAIAIIMVAITGPFMSAERTIVIAGITRDKTTAAFLAQEGLEYARALRDKVYLKDCYEAPSSCNSWWSKYTNSFEYDILQCTVRTPCSLDTSSSKSTYSKPNASPFSMSTTELHICTSSSSTCGKLYLNTVTGQYTTKAGGNKTTSFTRTISASPSSPGIKITSTVRWNDHGIHSTSVSDYLTPWL